MATIVLANGRVRLEVAPEHGASVVALEALLAGGWRPILRPTPVAALADGNVSKMASFTLAPYSNRLANARFSFGGREYRLEPNTPDGHVQHGDVRRRPWRSLSVSPTRATLGFDSRAFPDFNFPFPLAAEITYEIDGATISTRLELRNVGAEVMPVGLGFHPYFVRTLLGDPGVELQLSARAHFSGRVPSGPAQPLPPELDFCVRRPLGETPLSTCCVGWDGRARMRWPSAGVTVTMMAEPPLGCVVLFAPEGEPFFAVEPVSNATNGFNLYAAGVPDTGVIELAPGASVTGAFSLTITTL